MSRRQNRKPKPKSTDSDTMFPAPIETVRTPDPKVEVSKSTQLLRDIKADKKMVRRSGGRVEIIDPYANAESGKTMVQKPTGLAYDSEMAEHYCPWDENYPERPERYMIPFEAIKESGLFDRCKKIISGVREDVLIHIEKIHTSDHCRQLNDITLDEDEDRLESKASDYDAIYFCQKTYEVALRATSAMINLTLAVIKGQCKNGFALIRPPGHHAERESYVGYCYFNNVAIAAKMVIDMGFADRVLIVDLDVHHGQATQEAFFDSFNCLYFSIHRYEQGAFWPNLSQSNYPFIGRGAGRGFNVNVPLNEIGCTDTDYMAIILNVLLPMAYEYNPNIIFVSAGYDAMIADPEGQMEVTPAMYGQAITLLSGLAQGRIVCALEGGYHIPSLTEGILTTIRALLGDPAPPMAPLADIKVSVTESIMNVKRVLLPYWKSLSVSEDALFGLKSEEHQFDYIYVGDKENPPYPTRNCYPLVDRAAEKRAEVLLENYRDSLSLASSTVLMSTDTMMLNHAPPCVGGPTIHELPERLKKILLKYEEYGLDGRLYYLPPAPHEHFRQYYKATPAYWEQLKHNKIKQKTDIYTNEYTYLATRTAVNCCLTVCDKIMNQLGACGIALVRPPGHHAEYDKAMGYCFVNNAVISANYLRQKHKLKKILIVDFDVHHGNGTQSAFYGTNEVMYISIHRYDDGSFFPAHTNSNYKDDGYLLGKGYNINIPLSRGKMGDSDYLTVFFRIVLPLAYAFGPEVVIVSAGFDAGINDPLGGYRVSPETFGHFVQLMRGLARGRLLVVLEGGYNYETTSTGAVYCAKALLNDPMPMPKELFSKHEDGVHFMKQMINHYKKYWPFLGVNRQLSGVISVHRIQDPSDTDDEQNYITEYPLEEFYNVFRICF